MMKFPSDQNKVRPLLVDPRKTKSEDVRRRLWFKLAKKPKHAVNESISKMQSELREYVSILRSLERCDGEGNGLTESTLDLTHGNIRLLRQAYFVNRQLQTDPNDRE